MTENNNLEKLLINLTGEISRLADAVEIISMAPEFRTPKPDIIRIGLMNTMDFKKYSTRIPHYGGCWWLAGEEKTAKEASIVTADGNADKISVLADWVYVRPTLYIANGAEFAYKQCVKVGKYFFTYVGGDCLICNVGTNVCLYKDVMNWLPWQWRNLVFGTWDWMKENRPAKTMQIPENYTLTLISAVEYRKLRENIPIITDGWWLRDENGEDTVYAICNGDNVSGFERDENMNFLIRPAMVISNNVAGLNIRDRVRIGNKYFTYIGDNYLLMDQPTVKMGYELLPVPWNESAICKYLNQRS